jgi:hypothetical protein
MVLLLLQSSKPMEMAQCQQNGLSAIKIKEAEVTLERAAMSRF